MARRRQRDQAAGSGRPAKTGTMRQVAEDFLSRFGSLVDEIVSLRRDGPGGEGERSAAERTRGGGRPLP